nr:hypothetical protein [Paenibacillus larvae]
MRVKRYVVDSMPDALQKIRTDLGKDAVIMNTKEIRSGGFLGFFSKKRIEVIAAIEQENTVKTAKEPPVSRPKAKSAAVPAKSATAKKEQPAQPEPVKPVPAVPAATVPKAYKAAVAVSSPHDQPAEAVKEVSQLSTAFLSEMKAFREEAAETSDQAGEPVSREPEVPHSSREDVLLSEIQQLKAMMAQMSAVGVQPPLPGQSRLLVWSVISGTRGLIRSGLKNCLIKRIPPPRVHKQHGLRMSSGSRLLRS